MGARLTSPVLQVSPTEREDAELWYLSVIGKSQASELEKDELHPRWKDLVDSESLPAVSRP